MTGRAAAPEAITVAYVTPGFPPRLGGVERHVAELAGRAAREGWVVDVLSQDGRGRNSVEIRGGITVRRFSSVSPSETFPFAPALFAYLHRHGAQYSVVHAHNYHSLPALGAALVSGGRLIFTPHYLGSGNSVRIRSLHRMYAPAGRLIFRRAAHVVCVTRAEAEAVQEHFRVPSRQLSVIPNGVDVDEIRTADPFRVDAPIVLSVGRLETYKNVDLTIRALAYLQDPVVLCIAGDGPARHRLQSLARDLGVDRRVEFLGHLDRPTLYRWYRTASVYVSMSGRECFGITLLEALAGGATVVAADTTVHREVLAAGGVIHGKLVPLERGSRGLADTLTAALANGGPAGEPQLPSWDEIAIRTFDLYRSLLDTGRMEAL